MKFSTTLLSTTLLITPALSGPISMFQDASNFAIRKVLSNFMNETTVERVMTKPVIEPHPFVIDLTDDSWEVSLRTGTDDPFGKPLEDVVWVITVYGPDAVSKMMLKASDDTARYNSSAAGGELPSDMRFARIDYNVETVLPSLFNLWKVPIIVIATNDLQDLRFFKVPFIAPFHYQMSHLLNNRTLWETMQKWEGALAPGGSLNPYLHKIARGWATYHQYMSKIPTFFLLAISGALMNIVVSWFHKDSKKRTTPATSKIVTGTSSGKSATIKTTKLSREAQRAELKEKWDKEITEGKRKPTIVESVKETSKTTGVVGKGEEVEKDEGKV